MRLEETGVLLFPPKLVARILGVSKATVHRLIQRGRLQGVHTEGLESVRIPRDSLEQFLTEWEPVNGTIRSCRSPGRPRREQRA